MGVFRPVKSPFSDVRSVLALRVLGISSKCPSVSFIGKGGLGTGTECDSDDGAAKGIMAGPWSRQLVATSGIICSLAG